MLVYFTKPLWDQLACLFRSDDKFKLSLIEDDEFKLVDPETFQSRKKFIEFLTNASMYRSEPNEELLRTYWAVYHTSEIEFRFVCHEEVMAAIIEEASNRNESLTSLYFDYCHGQIERYITRNKRKLLDYILSEPETDRRFHNPTILITVDNTIQATFPPILLVS